MRLFCEQKPSGEFLKTKKGERRTNAGKISKENFQQIKASYMGVLKHCKNKKIKRDLQKIPFFIILLYNKSIMQQFFTQNSDMILRLH